jgi:hypothetical protein
MFRLLQFSVVLFLALIFTPALSSAQELIFCLDHTKDGTPLARSKQFELESFGQELALVFRTKEVIQSEKLYFFVDIFQGEAFVEFDTKTSQPEPGNNWSSVRYKFERSGKYRVVVLDGEKRELCKDIVEVNVREEENSPAYFEGAKVVFCNQAPSGVADTAFFEYKLRTATVKTFSVLVNHDRPLSTERIVVDVWLGGGNPIGIGSAGMYLETLEFQVEPHWNYTQFDYPINGAGVYTFRVYNQHEIWISNGVLEVMME